MQGLQNFSEKQIDISEQRSLKEANLGYRGRLSKHTHTHVHVHSHLVLSPPQACLYKPCALRP